MEPSDWQIKSILPVENDYFLLYVSKYVIINYLGEA
jgi:hypothetical protein